MTAFQGAHVLITGAASGLGRLMALGATARGACVSLLDRDAKGLGQVCESIHGLKGDAEGFVVDLSDRTAIQATCAEVRAHRGGVDILINNAAIVSGKTLLEGSDEGIERTFQANVLANSWTVRAFLPDMLAAGKGHIVTVASAAGLGGDLAPGHAPLRDHRARHSSAPALPLRRRARLLRCEPEHG